jgi:hypothetical protein
MDELEMALLNAAQAYVDQYDTNPDTWPDAVTRTLHHAHAMLKSFRAAQFSPDRKDAFRIRLAAGKAELVYRVTEVMPGRFAYEMADGSGVGMGYRTAGLACTAAEKRAGWEIEE